MFTVYGLNGRVYSGPLEGLRSLEPVQAVARLRAVAPVSALLESEAQAEAGVVRAEPNPEANLMALGHAEPRPRDALAAYAKAQARVLPDEKRQPLRLVEELMSRELVTVPAVASVAQGLAMLSRAKVGQAPVLNPRGRLVGLLLRGDLLPVPDDVEDAQAWSAWFARPVGDVMWSPVPSAHADTPLREVAQALLDFRLPGMPVSDEKGELLGFISRSDILRALTREPPLELWS